MESTESKNVHLTGLSDIIAHSRHFNAGSCHRPISISSPAQPPPLPPPPSVLRPSVKRYISLTQFGQKNLFEQANRCLLPKAILLWTWLCIQVEALHQRLNSKERKKKRKRKEKEEEEVEEKSIGQCKCIQFEISQVKWRRFCRRPRSIVLKMQPES